MFVLLAKKNITLLFEFFPTARDAINCTAPMALENGLIESNPSYTIYICDRGYSIHGVNVRHCNESGTWLDGEPRCFGKWCSTSGM